MNLYILGNGFDVAHGLQTSYRNFRSYLQRKHPSLLHRMREFYDVEIGSDLWKTFEFELGKMETSHIEEQFYEPNYSSDEFRDGDYDDNAILVENEIDFIEDLKQAFSEWISSVGGGVIIEPKLAFSFPAKFITFNYTFTLEEVYGISEDDILHIHGSIGQDLVFGHDVDVSNWKKLKMFGPQPDELDEAYESEREVDYAVERGYDVLGFMFYRLCKKVDRNLAKCDSFISNLHDIRKVVVLGATLANGDDTYLRSLNNRLSLADCEWNVYYFKEEEKECLRRIVIQCGVSADNVVMRSSDGLSGTI